MSLIGTISRGIKAPIIKKGDDLVKIVTESVLAASKEGNFALQDRDVVAVTEAILGRAQGNYATVDDIAADVRAKMKGARTVGLVFPILSRNRFSLILKGISMGVEKLIIQLSYPSDEVGNPLISYDKIDAMGIDAMTKTFSEEEFRKTFGDPVHPFTGVDYLKYYRELCPNSEIILSNDPCAILRHTGFVVNADIHTRRRTKARLLRAGAEIVLSLDEILNRSVNGSGYHEQYGVLGSNLATDRSVKLFPRNAQQFAEDLAHSLRSATGKQIECMVYGDGAFKDPVGGIWELADPIVSPGYTSGLEGTPNELKLKYLADNQLGNLSGKEAEQEIKRLIRQKDENLVNRMVSQGTTPRRLTDLLGSLSDLTSGSGDKGTPIVLIQNYFKNYSE